MNEGWLSNMITTKKIEKWLYHVLWKVFEFLVVCTINEKIYLCSLNTIKFTVRLKYITLLILILYYCVYAYMYI